MNQTTHSANGPANFPIGNSVAGPAPTPNSVMSLIETLHKTISDANMQAAELEIALSPVLRSPYPELKSGTASGDVRGEPIAIEGLAEAITKIQAIANQIQSLRNRSAIAA